MANLRMRNFLLRYLHGPWRQLSAPYNPPASSWSLIIHLSAFSWVYFEWPHSSYLYLAPIPRNPFYSQEDYDWILYFLFFSQTILLILLMLTSCNFFFLFNLCSSKQFIFEIQISPGSIIIQSLFILLIKKKREAIKQQEKKKK